VLGNTIYNSTLNAQNNTISLVGFSNVMYQVRVLKCGNLVYQTKVVKQEQIFYTILFVVTLHSLKVKKAIFILISCILFLATNAQVKHKVMVIPFEPKLYMSEIDYKINAETKLNQKEIKEVFRKGINAELTRALKQKYEVLDLLKDTAKYKKDIQNIYRNITFNFEKVPDQCNYKAPVEEKGKKSETIKNGQILMESNTDARFMNTKVTSPKLIPELYAKYKTDLFLFVNQLDVLTGEIVGFSDLTYKQDRTLTLHYTVFTVDAKEINSGTCRIKFPADVNTPAKMTSGYVSKIATEITRRIVLALSKTEAAPKK
jgi:hypothetical protein